MLKLETVDCSNFADCTNMNNLSTTINTIALLSAPLIGFITKFLVEGISSYHNLISESKLWPRLKRAGSAQAGPKNIELDLKASYNNMRSQAKAHTQFLIS